MVVRRKKRKTSTVAARRRRRRPSRQQLHRPSVSFKKLILKAARGGVAGRRGRRGGVATAFPPTLPMLHSAAATHRAAGGRGTSRARGKKSRRRLRGAGAGGSWLTI